LSVPKPTCGSQGPSSDDTLTAIIAVIGTLGTIVSTGKEIAGTIGPAIGTTEVALAAAATLIQWAAVAGAIITFTVVSVFYWKRCHDKPRGLNACSAGVINGTQTSFDSVSDNVFPFTAMHDRVDVVVKSQYWSLVESNALSIRCAGDSLQSPLIQCFYESPEVCGAGVGSLVGGVAGVVGGIIAGAAVGAAIGCATVILCIFALLAAFLIAAAAVLLGALIGGQLGKAAAGDTDPSVEGELLGVGDYITTKGNVITHGDFDGARVYWFVKETSLHGRSLASPDFSHTDPDSNLIPDACPTAPVL
jgi:hypothetical protein